MTKRNLLIVIGTAALGISLAALPGISKPTEPQQDNSVAALKREIAELKAKLAAAQEMQELQELPAPEIAEGPEIFVDGDREVFNIQAPEPAEGRALRKVRALDGEGGGWPGVQTQEGTAGKGKDWRF